MWSETATQAVLEHASIVSVKGKRFNSQLMASNTRHFLTHIFQILPEPEFLNIHTLWIIRAEAPLSGSVDMSGFFRYQPYISFLPLLIDDGHPHIIESNRIGAR
jgi:hypothetical protein